MRVPTSGGCSATRAAVEALVPLVPALPSCSSAICHQNIGDFVDGAAALQEVLSRLGLGGHRSREHTADELGIAWTAHELKGPLAGARAALDLAWERATEVEDKELLRRVNQELDSCRT